MAKSHVREQLAKGGGSMFQYIPSEEKSYLNVSLTSYPQHANSPDSFVSAQRTDWQQYWFAEDQLTRAVLLSLLSVFVRSPRPSHVL